MNGSKKIVLLLLLSIKLVASSENQMLEAILRKVNDIEKKQADMLPRVRSIQTNVIDTLQLASSGGFISAFGEALTNHPLDQINIEFQYGISDLNTSFALVTTGTLFVQDSMAVLSTGTDPNGQVRFESKDSLRYRTGHEAYAFFTAIFTPGVPNSKQQIGVFDHEDGVNIGFNGTDFSILFRRNGDPDIIIPQSDFNRDTLDGTGESGFNLDPSKLNLYRISYGWLGAAPIKFQVMRSDGVWITFHVIERTNLFTGPSFKNPVLPIQAIVENSGNTTDIRLLTPSWNVGIVANPDTTPASRFFSKSVSTTVASANTETHLLTLHNKDTFNGFNNKITVRVAAISGGGNDFSNNPTLIRLRKNAMVTGTSFSDIEIDDSVIEFSTAGTFVDDGQPEAFLLGTNTFGSGPQVAFLHKNDYVVTFVPEETVTLTAECIGSSGIVVFASISWEELF